MRKWDSRVSYAFALSLLFVSLILDTQAQNNWSLILRVVSLLIFVFTRIRHSQEYGGGFVITILHCLGWIVAILGLQLRQWIGASIGSTALFLVGCATAGYAMFCSNKLMQKKNPVWITVVAAVFVLTYFIVLFSDALFGNFGFQGETPFGHIYRVDEVLESLDAIEEQLPLIRLDYRMEAVLESTAPMEEQASSDSTSYRMQNILELMANPSSRQWITIGSMEFQKQEADNTNLLHKGVWLLVLKDESQYRLTVENDNSVVLSYTREGQLQWKYLLSRVDTLICTVKSSYSVESPVLEWYPQGTFQGEVSILNGADIQEEGTVAFHWLDDTTDTLTVIEEYYSADQVEVIKHSVSINSRKQFVLPVKIRSSKENQYAIYRIPFENGEYVFTIRFFN